QRPCVLLAATAARAEDARPLHGPWVGAIASTSSRFTVGIREEGRTSEGEFETTVGLGVRAGYDFLEYAGVWAEYEEEVHYGSFGGGLRLITPTETFRAGLSAGLRFIPHEPTLPFFTVGLLGEVRPWRHLGFGLEVARGWPLKGEVTRAQKGSTPQRIITLDGGPLRVALGLSWYF
ncbi:hypothetical protein, partial [Corallococcus aberystwythensis]